MLRQIKNMEGGTPLRGDSPLPPPSKKLEYSTSLRLYEYSETEKKRAIEDIVYIMTADLYINEKGYLNKCIDLLLKLGYYKNNKSIIEEYWKQHE